MRSRRTFLIVLVVLALAVMGVYLVAFQEAGDEQLEQEASADSIAGVDKGEYRADLDKQIEETRHLQERRKNIMDEMVSSGIASRIENPKGEPFVYVLKPFYGLNRQEQASLLNVIWSYYITEDKDAGVLTVYDDETGNEIGTYSRNGINMVE